MRYEEEDWQDRKKEVITHPYLQEKSNVGTCPSYTGTAIGKAYKRRHRTISFIYVEVVKICWF